MENNKKLKKKQRIEELEKRVAKLESLINCSRVEDPTPLTFKVETTNQLRAKIIEKSKKFVEEQFIEGNMGVGKVVCGLHGHNLVEFIVNYKKRTVVALLRLAYVPEKEVVLKGIAKCDPADVFNEDIGKAIALGRALVLDVSEFENAIQPSLAIGQEIQVVSLDDKPTGWFRVVEDIRNNIPYYNSIKHCNKYIIENDTNAVY